MLLTINKLQVSLQSVFLGSNYRIMKNAIFILNFFVIASLVSCGGGSSAPANDIEGIWTLTKLEKEGEGAVELTECDEQTKWNFTKEKAEALSDGTEVMQLKAEAPDDCKFFGFDAKWTEKDGEIFISSTRIGGMGGVSNAGMFEVVESTPNKLVLQIMKNKYTLTK